MLSASNVLTMGSPRLLDGIFRMSRRRVEMHAETLSDISGKSEQQRLAGLVVPVAFHV